MAQAEHAYYSIWADARAVRPYRRVGASRRLMTHAERAYYSNLLRGFATLNDARGACLLLKFGEGGFGEVIFQVGAEILDGISADYGVFVEMMIIYHFR